MLHLFIKVLLNINRLEFFISFFELTLSEFLWNLIMPTFRHTCRASAGSPCRRRESRRQSRWRCRACPACGVWRTWRSSCPGSRTQACRRGATTSRGRAPSWTRAACPCRTGGLACSGSSRWTWATCRGRHALRNRTKSWKEQKGWNLRLSPAKK